MDRLGEEDSEGREGARRGGDEVTRKTRAVAGLQSARDPKAGSRPRRSSRQDSFELPSFWMEIDDWRRVSSEVEHAAIGGFEARQKAREEEGDKTKRRPAWDKAENEVRQQQGERAGSKAGGGGGLLSECFKALAARL
ncbi:hypothetical protein MKX07_006680 [Trichoderma sp. CBMAI-0711]|nr:hypothetical protein MKX07_006680 [Trichoderma sp. CBMAI-0711]